MNEFKRLLINAGVKNTLFEGTWAAPQTEKQALKLQALMQNPLPAGQATNVLYHLIGDDELFDNINEIEDKDGPGADVRYIIASRLKNWLDEMDQANWRNPWDPKALAIIKGLVEKYTNLNESSQMTLDHAKFIIKASRDWLDRRNQLKNFQTTGDYDADYQRKENIEEEMAYIQGILEEHKMMHGYDSVNEMFQAAKEMVLNTQQFESMDEAACEKDLNPKSSN